MNDLTTFLTTCLQADWAERTGWTLVHSLWQIAAITGVYAILMLLLRNRSASARYVVGCVAMAAMLALPAVTYVVLPPSVVPEVEVFSDQTPVAAVPLPKPSMTPREFTFTEPEAIAVDPLAAAPIPAEDEAPTFMATLSSSMQHWTPWITAAWLIGVLLLSFRPVWGWLHVRRLRRHGLAPLSDPLQEMCGYLATRLGVRRAVEFAQSTLVEVPTVVGYLKPMILLPASALSGLSTSQIELILAHELAHVRRHDYLVNLVQTVVESLLFYHPGMWWVSGQIRRERENCCDDMALALGGSRANYVRALAQLEERRSVPAAALAASGGSLLLRARRLLGQPQGGFGYRHATAWLAGILTIGLVAAVLAVNGIAQDRAKDSATPNVEAGESNDTEADAPIPDNDNIIWDKPHAGWQVGVKLLSTTDKLQPGEPVVMQTLLKNVTDESRTVVLLDYHDTDPTLDADGYIHMNVDNENTRVKRSEDGRPVITAKVPGNDSNGRPHVVAPGAVLKKSRVVLVTNGLPPGRYCVDPQPAFWEPKRDDPGWVNGIGWNTPVRFTLGNPASVKYTHPPKEIDGLPVHWGKPVSGLVAGVRLPRGREQQPPWQSDGGEMFVRNVSNRTIRFECKGEPSHPANLLKTSDGKNAGFAPEGSRLASERFSYTLQSGEHVRIPKSTRATSVVCWTEETPSKQDGRARRIADTGQSMWNAFLTVRQEHIPGLSMVVYSAAVPHEMGGENGESVGDAAATEAPKSPSEKDAPKTAEDQADLNAMRAYAAALSAGDFETLEKTWEFQNDLDRQWARKMAEMFDKAKEMRVDLVSMRRLGKNSLYACFLIRNGPDGYAREPLPMSLTFHRKDGRWRCSPPGDLRSILGTRSMGVEQIGRRAISQNIIAMRLGSMDASSQIARMKVQAEAFACLAGPPYNLSRFKAVASQMKEQMEKQEALLQDIRTEEDLWRLAIREGGKKMMPKPDDFILSFYLEAEKDEPHARELPFADSDETFRAEPFPCLTEDTVLEAKVVANPVRNVPAVEVKLTEGGKKLFAKLTRESIGKRLGIVVDGKVVSAPIIHAEISGGKARIAGDFALEEAQAIADKLNAYREEARKFLEEFGKEMQDAKTSKTSTVRPQRTEEQ